MKERSIQTREKSQPVYSVQFFLMAMFIAIALLLSGPHALAGQDEHLPKVLHVAFSTRIFPDVDHSDARIAMELWAKELSRKAGIPHARVTLFTNPDAIEGMVRRGDVHLVILPPADYLAWRRLPLAPAYVAANKSGKEMEYLLVVRRDSGLSGVRDLRGKTLALSSAAKDPIGFLWITVLTLREGVGDAGCFIGKFSEVHKSSKAVLGVFFRQYQAAIVSRGSLETCIAVNPQLGKELTVIASSKSMIGEISCIPSTVGKRLRESMDNAAVTLHETPAGRQIATLFRINRVIPFNPSYLEGLEDLLRERDRLAKIRVKKPCKEDRGKMQ